MKKRRLYYGVCQGALFFAIIGWVAVQWFPMNRQNLKGNFTYIGQVVQDWETQPFVEIKVQE